MIERLIRFLDLDGRTLALRYDFTASVARVAATAFADRPLPLRLCYSGKVYRQEPDRGARPREILQVGAELLGAGGLAADLELIRLALRLAAAVGLRDFQLNLGHIGALAPALAALPEALRPDVRRWIDRKDRGSLARALGPLDGDARALLTLPFVMGRRAALEDARVSAPGHRAVPRSITSSRWMRADRGRSGRTSSTTWARCAASTTTPACSSSCSWRAPAGRRARAAGTTA